MIHPDQTQAPTTINSTAVQLKNHSHTKAYRYNMPTHTTWKCDHCGWFHCEHYACWAHIMCDECAEDCECDTDEETGEPSCLTGRDDVW